jgi:thiamine pyrophosphate-dependent acetolactate synthase large subunit-like protein
MADQERLSGAQILVEYLVRQRVTHAAGIPNIEALPSNS